MRRAVAAVALLASFTTAGPARSTAPPISVAPLGAGPLYSDNVSLVATQPDTGMVGGAFAGGYFFSTIASVAAFEPGPNSGVRIYDVSNPELPVPIGVLPLPHGENEDVEVIEARKLLLISMETYGRLFAPRGYEESWPVQDFVYVVSWENPAAPVVVGRLQLPTRVKRKDGVTSAGPGHIINCIDACKRYAYVTGAGDGSLLIVDLADPANPSIAGWAAPNKVVAGKRNLRKENGYIHDVNTDQFGRVWTTGSGGTAQLDVRDPLRPVATRWVDWRDNDRLNQSVHHNSLALDRSTLLVTEEDYTTPNCENDGSAAVEGYEQGTFQTWRVNESRRRGGALKPLDDWKTEVEAYGQGSRPATIYCSSHWFTFNEDKIVAVGWYDQGVRFLDVSNPRDIRQVGYWLGPAAQASAAYFVPGHKDLVYVTDYVRGLDVVRIDGGGRAASTVVAPLRAEWFQPLPARMLEADQRFGWACRRPVRA